MSVRAFLDTNVLVYTFDATAPDKQHRALDLVERSLADRYGYDLNDALVVAAALHGGATTLLSEDLQHGQAIDGLTIRDPFR